MARPGRSFLTDQRQVVLVPRPVAFVATFCAPEADPPCAVYVDISTPSYDAAAATGWLATLGTAMMQP